mmetsp:Transcript_72219/g.190413  ORF Transcript_72219/g.190413 Transcript_72219/m.190413 type:complete len:216 (+) Transcript_72219:91-738(+)
MRWRSATTCNTGRPLWLQRWYLTTCDSGSVRWRTSASTGHSCTGRIWCWNRTTCYSRCNRRTSSSTFDTWCTRTSRDASDASRWSSSPRHTQQTPGYWHLAACNSWRLWSSRECHAQYASPRTCRLGAACDTRRVWASRPCIPMHPWGALQRIAAATSHARSTSASFGASSDTSELRTLSWFSSALHSSIARWSWQCSTSGYAWRSAARCRSPSG